MDISGKLDISICNIIDALIVRLVKITERNNTSIISFIDLMKGV